MRAVTLTLLYALAPAAVAAQDTTIVIHPDSSGATLQVRELPRVVAEEVIRLYNAPGVTRLVGRTRLPRGNEWRGDVAVRNGPVLVGGRIQGMLLVINGDALLEPGAEITGALIVVGGTIDGTTDARIGGEVRQYREPLPYRVLGEGDEIAYASNLRRRVWNPGARVSWGTAESRSSLTIATGGTFNRVEGLPIVFGPLFDWKLQDEVRFRLDALGVFRSAGDLSDKRGDLGYMLRAELRSGSVRAVGVGFRAYDVVAPTEDWGLRNAEVGWSAFLFARDYRDYYLNKGVAGRVFAQPERQIALALELRRDWQTSVAARDPWTLFRNADPWRPNPPVDEGHYTTVSATATLDTRNDAEEPTAGWLVRGTLEHSRSKDVAPQPGVPAVVRGTIPTDGSYAFNRLFLDARRYARVSPSGRLNLRLVAGGWLGGDPLPLQRRLSLGGPDPLPGYRFRHSACNRDIIDAAFAGSRLAACDRMLALQMEYRGHLKLNWSYNPARDEGEGGGRRRIGASRCCGSRGRTWSCSATPGRRGSWAPGPAGCRATGCPRWAAGSPISGSASTGAGSGCTSPRRSRPASGCASRCGSTTGSKVRGGARAAVWALLWSAAAGAPATAQAPSLTVTLQSAVPRVQSMGLLADGKFVTLMRSGFPLRLHYRLELWKVRGSWFDKFVREAEWDAVARHDPLADDFVLIRSGGAVTRYATPEELARALEIAYTVTLSPAGAGAGRFYFLCRLDVTTLNDTDLEELSRWLKGDVGPAVSGEGNLGEALARGAQRVLVRIAGLPRQRLEARSPILRTDGR